MADEKVVTIPLSKLSGELAEKRRQLAGVEGALAKDIDGIHEPAAIAA